MKYVMFGIVWQVITAGLLSNLFNQETALVCSVICVGVGGAVSSLAFQDHLPDEELTNFFAVLIGGLIGFWSLNQYWCG